MKAKTLLIILSLMALLTGGVLAHDTDDSPLMRRAALRWSHHGIALDLLSETLLEASGMDAPQLYDALMDGATLVELIAANDGDTAAASAALTAQISQRMQTAADSAIADLESHFTDALERSHVDKRRWRRARLIPRLPFTGALNSVILEATGLDESALRAAMMDGSSIAQLIEANDGDIGEVAATLTAQATEQIKDKSAARIERVGAVVDEAMQRDFSEVFERMRKFRRNPFSFFHFRGDLDMDGDYADADHKDGDHDDRDHDDDDHANESAEVEAADEADEADED